MSGLRQTLKNWLYVLLLGAGVGALAWLWQYDVPPPEVVDGIAAAAGLRPPQGPVSQLWLSIASPLCARLGVNAAYEVLRAAGHLSLAALAAMACAILVMLLPDSMRRGAHLASWWRAVLRFVVFQGVLFFCLSDPVWNSFRWFSPHALQTLLATFAALCLVAHFKRGIRAPLFASFVLLGVLVSDTPSGVPLLVSAAVALRVRRFLRDSGQLPVPDENPLADFLIKWRLTLSFLIGFAAGTTLGARAFAAAGGLEAFGWTWGDYAVALPLMYVKTFARECSPLGLAQMMAVVVLPVAASAELVKTSVDDESHLKYMHGLVFATLGLLAFSQIAGAKTLWFWRWSSTETLCDGVMKNCAMFLCALTAAMSIGVFAMELYLRNFRRIEQLRLPDAAEQPGAEEAFAKAGRLQRTVRAFFLLEPLLALSCVVPFRVERCERDMLDVVAEVARETAEECRGVGILFTDGGMDAAVEISSAKRGRRLRTFSLMGGATNRRDIYLRTRGIDDPEDRTLLESGAADALRAWVSSHPEKAGTYAVQIGFELWRRNALPMPTCSGLVARPEGFTEDEAERGAAEGRRLARRVLEIYEKYDPDAISDHAIRDLFLFAQWRIAVLARHRANAYDKRGNDVLAVEETRLADGLDRMNSALARIHDSMAWLGRRRIERLTPREGLKIALSRADFALARAFALRVLDLAPDDPSANFAVGMDFFVQRQYARAQSYLERCLIHRPNDPAVLNNLAQCHLRQGDPSAALKYAERAQDILPDSQEVMRTMERIKAALAEDGAPAAELGGR